MAKKSKGIFLVYVDIDAKHDKEFNDWYNTEHLPELLAVPGILSAARYKAVKSGPKYLAFYELENAGVMGTPGFTNRPRTSWGQRVSPSVIGSNNVVMIGSVLRAVGGSGPPLSSILLNYRSMTNASFELSSQAWGALSHIRTSTT